MARAIAPLPVPRSTAIGSGAASARSASMASWATISVSGRGTKTPGSDGELERAERRAAGDVLQRLPGGPAGDERVGSPTASVVETRPPMTSRACSAATAESEHVADQQLGVDLGRDTPAAASARDDSASRSREVGGACVASRHIHVKECNALA